MKRQHLALLEAELLTDVALGLGELTVGVDEQAAARSDKDLQQKPPQLAKQEKRIIYVGC